MVGSPVYFSFALSKRVSKPLMFAAIVFMFAAKVS